MTNLRNFKKILTFFAHPDDETLAAGATLNKLAASGVEIHVAIPATGIHARRNQKNFRSRELKLKKLQKNCKKAINSLAMDNVSIYFGKFKDNEMDKGTLLELVQWFENILLKVKPDAVFTHHRFCTNIDHQYCHEAAVIATRPSLELHIPLICGEVPSSTGYLKPAQWEPNFYVEISQKQLKSKILAMSNYAGEVRPDPHPRSREVLNALAKIRGSEAGFYFAESFMVQKDFG